MSGVCFVFGICGLRYLLILLCLFCFGSWRTLYPLILSYPPVGYTGLGRLFPGVSFTPLPICALHPLPRRPYPLPLSSIPSTHPLDYRLDPSIHSVVDLSIHTPHALRREDAKMNVSYGVLDAGFCGPDSPLSPLDSSS